MTNQNEIPNPSYVGRTVVLTQEFIDYKQRTIGLEFSPEYHVGDEYQIVGVAGSGFQISNGGLGVYCPIHFAAAMLKR